MNDMKFFSKGLQKILEIFTGIYEYGNDPFQALFCPKHPELQARHLLALRCADIITRGVILRRWQQTNRLPVRSLDRLKAPDGHHNFSFREELAAGFNRAVIDPRLPAHCLGL